MSGRTYRFGHRDGRSRTITMGVDKMADWIDHVDEEETTDPSIYIRVSRPREQAFDWYNLSNTTSKNWNNSISQCLNRCFPRRPTEHRYSSCISMGSTILVVGGGGIETNSLCNFGPNYAREGNERYRDVWFIDTRSSSSLNKGWIEGMPLRDGRAKPILACFGGKVYVVSGLSLHNAPLDIFVEVLEGNKSVRPVHYEYDVCAFPTLDTSHVHIDADNDRILIHYDADTHLYSYDVHKNKLDLLSDRFDMHRKASAIVDGIMYTIDYSNPGQLVAYDISKHGCSAIPVEFLDPTQYPHLPRRPQPGYFMVALGNQRLAVVWSEIEVVEDRLPSRRVRLSIFCSKWKMTKVQETDTIVKLVASQRSVKQYMVEDDGILESCLVVGQKSVSTSGETDATVEEEEETIGNLASNNSSLWGWTSAVKLFIIVGIATLAGGHLKLPPPIKGLPAIKGSMFPLDMD